MKMKYFSLVLFNIYLIYGYGESSDVIFSTIIFRHGDRTPVSTFPNDPNSNYSLWKEIGLGQLTKTGKAQHYLLGKWLRYRYNHLISPEYSTNEIYIRSTDVDRTLMSALSNLAGLFPPDSNQIWSDQVKDWQPIPVHTLPETEDNVLAGKKFCQKYNLETEQLLSSPEFKQYEEMNKELYAYLTENTGRNISTILDLNNLYDTLFIEDLYQLPLPKWTKSVYPQPLKDWASFSFRVQCYTATLAKLKIGLLLNEIIERMELKSRGLLIPDRSIWMYSAHDVTIANILMALSLFNNECPPYTATLMFELRKQNQEYGVSMYLRNNSNEMPYLLKLPKCDEFCELSKFKYELSSILITPEQWRDECDVGFFTSFTYTTNQINTTAIFVVLAGTFTILLLIASSVICLAYINRNQNKFYLRLDVNEN